MGVLTHLDTFKNNKVLLRHLQRSSFMFCIIQIFLQTIRPRIFYVQALSRTKKNLKHRWNPEKIRNRKKKLGTLIDIDLIVWLLTLIKNSSYFTDWLIVDFTQISSYLTMYGTCTQWIWIKMEKTDYLAKNWGLAGFTIAITVFVSSIKCMFYDTERLWLSEHLSISISKWESKWNKLQHWLRFWTENYQ